MEEIPRDTRGRENCLEDEDVEDWLQVEEQASEQLQEQVPEQLQERASALAEGMRLRLGAQMTAAGTGRQKTPTRVRCEPASGGPPTQ